MKRVLLAITLCDVVGSGLSTQDAPWPDLSEETWEAMSMSRLDSVLRGNDFNVQNPDGGTRSNRFTYTGSNDVNAVAWYSSNSINRSQPVGGKQANELGLHDIPLPVSGYRQQDCEDRRTDGAENHRVTQFTVLGTVETERGDSTDRILSRLTGAILIHTDHQDRRH